MSKQEKDAFCSVGLLSLAEQGEVHSRLGECGRVLADIIREQFPDRASWMSASGESTPESIIVGFNDHPDTTFADVERVFEKAEVAWDERI